MLMSDIEALGYFAATAFLHERPQASMRALILASSSAWAAGVKAVQEQTNRAALRRREESFIKHEEMPSDITSGDDPVTSKKIATLLDVTSANAAKNGLLEQRPELRGLQAAGLQGQVPQNLPCLNAEVEKMSPAMVVKASRP